MENDDFNQTESTAASTCWAIVAHKADDGLPRATAVVAVVGRFRVVGETGIVRNACRLPDRRERDRTRVDELLQRLESDLHALREELVGEVVP